MTTNKAAAVVSEEQVELAAIALANVHRGHPNPKAYWAWMHEDEQAKFRERATAALQAALGVGGWRSMDSAPKGGGAKYRTDPAWVEPPLILLSFPGGEQSVAYWDWYYAEGGCGFTDGHGWCERISGELVHNHYGLPTGWQPLPPPPSSEEG